MSGLSRREFLEHTTATGVLTFVASVPLAVAAAQPVDLWDDTLRLQLVRNNDPLTVCIHGFGFMSNSYRVADDCPISPWFAAASFVEAFATMKPFCQRTFGPPEKFQQALHEFATALQLQTLYYDLHTQRLRELLVDKLRPYYGEGLTVTR